MPPTPLRGAAALETLRARLHDGTWVVGTRLPGEHELAAELGVGRNTVREALRTLVNAGLLRARRGDGTYVIATDELEAALARRVDAEQAHRVLEVRGALEVEAARLAATRATREEVVHLRALLAEHDAANARRDDAAFVRSDLAWHEAVVRATGNQLLLDLYLGLDRTQTYARRAPAAEPAAEPASEPAATPATSPTAPETAPPTRLNSLRWAHQDLQDAHHRILDAIERRDPAAAAAAATSLIQGSHDLLDHHSPTQQEPQQ